MRSRILKIWIHMLFITLHRLFITRKTFHSLLITPHILFIRLHILLITFYMLFNTFICCFPPFISWWTNSNYYHILANTPYNFHIVSITLHMFMSIYFITSYVHEQYARNLIYYLSPFSSCFTIPSYLDEQVSVKFIAYFTLSVVIYHTSYLIYQTHILANSYVI